MSDATLLAGSEPVHWGSQLVRATSVFYTEVAETPVLIDAKVAEVQTLTPVWAGVWGALDGRPVAEVLQVDPTTMPPVDARNLIEVLRRLKARGLIVDVAALEGSGAQDLDTTEPSTAKLHCTFLGAVVRHGKERTLHLDNTEHEAISVVLYERDGTTQVVHGGRFRKKWINQVSIGAEVLHGGDVTPVGFLGAIVRCVSDRSLLTQPGMVDLLAGLAERATTPESIPA